MAMLIDSHSHIDDSSFDADRAQVIERARAAGVRAQIIPATTAASWAPMKALCDDEPSLWPAYGLHPTFLAEHRPAHLDALREWIERERPIALGEAGLDYWIEDLDRKAQQHYFEAQLSIARDFDLPVILHARKAYDAVTAALRRIGGLRGVVHSFSGSPEQAQQLWKIGFHIGIGGPVTYPRARRLRSLVATMPIEFLLLETDSPDQPLCGRQGRRNEPALLAEVLATVARLRDEAPEAIAERTRRNTERLFGMQLRANGNAT
jgi:TatD DNase family protein